MRISSFAPRALVLVALLSNGIQADSSVSVKDKNLLAELANNGGSNRMPGLETRVVGGDQVTSTSAYPFFVEWQSAACGGSLIWEDIVLSAAHCENVEHPFSTLMYINGITTKGGFFRNVEQQVSHPLYKSIYNNNDYDVMVLKLYKSALVDEDGNDTGAETVTLNKQDTVPDVGDKLMAVGFGVTQEGGTSISQTLQDVEVMYVDDRECAEQYGDGYVPDLMFCAGVPQGGKDTCQGDSGGPIIDQNTNTQVGVVSFGIGCARADFNGVYARVSSVTEWIEEQVCKLSSNPPAGCAARTDGGGPTDDNGPKNGEITIDIQYDEYANEMGIALIRDETQESIFFHPFMSAGFAQNGQTASHSFQDLAAGTYTLILGDQVEDGWCCSYGEGGLKLTDDKFNNLVYENDGMFSDYVRIQLEIESSGRVSVIDEDADYLSSWEASGPVKNYPQNVDQAWPGPVPATTNAMNINIKYDEFPDQVSWELFQQDGQQVGAWSSLQSFNGAVDGITNDLVSTQLVNLTEGWYKFVLQDSAGNGICCTFRRGWVAITGFLRATRRSGQVWGSDGEFDAGLEVYLYMNAAGMFSKLQDTAPTTTTAR